MTGSEVRAAIEVVAAAVAQAAVEDAIGDMWEQYPDIGEHDWTRVADEATAMAGSFTQPERFQAAYDLLAERANGVEA